MNIFVRMGYHLLQGTRNMPSDFTRLQGLHWQEYPNGLHDDQSNYYITDMKMEYGNEKLLFYLKVKVKRFLLFNGDGFAFISFFSCNTCYVLC